MQAQESHTIGQNVYTRKGSFYYHSDTPEGVKSALSNLYHSGQRVRIFQGDIATGETWSEEYDVIGTIGRSGGPCCVPLLIHNSRSTGGGAIMAHCILGILGRGGWIYKAPNFDNGNWTAAPIDETYGERRYLGAVYRDGALYGRCQSLEKAERLRAFMAGESLRK